MPIRGLLCLVCREVTLQTEPDFPQECEPCKSKQGYVPRQALWKVMDDDDIVTYDRRFLRSVRIRPDF